MPVLEPVIWAKGTVLNPQHLQIQDRFLTDSLQFHMQALQFPAVGLSTAAHRSAGPGHRHPGALRGRRHLRRRATVRHSGIRRRASAAQASRIGSARSRSRSDVFLAVPSYREQGLNVSNGLRDVEARYRAEVEMLRDENTGQSERPVVVARKNFRLLFEGESQEGNSLLQVARISKTAAGLYQLDPHFVAPLIDLRASDYLLSIARRLLEILSAKSSVLAGSRRQKNQSLADFTASDIASFWLLYTINTSFPGISHIFETGGGHPENLLLGDALAGRLADHVFAEDSSARPAGLQSRESGRLLHRTGREADHAARNRGADATSSRCRSSWCSRISTPAPSTRTST